MTITCEPGVSDGWEEARLAGLVPPVRFTETADRIAATMEGHRAAHRLTEATREATTHRAPRTRTTTRKRTLP